MSDKTLDCIGILLSGPAIGKHDFREMPTTNSVEQAPGLTVALLQSAMAQFRKAPSPELVIDHATMGKDFWQSIRSNAHPTHADRFPFGSLAGFKIFLDETLAPDVCEFRNRDGVVLGTFRLGG